jgi:hypothetical protein
LDEFDEDAGVYRLDRVLSSAVFYNFDYGFIEDTRAGDGDHTDALLIIDEPTFTGCHVWARPIGGLEMRDEKGFDFKVLCVAIGDAHQQHIKRLEQFARRENAKSLLVECVHPVDHPRVVEVTAELVAVHAGVIDATVHKCQQDDIRVYLCIILTANSKYRHWRRLAGRVFDRPKAAP